jgi:hypothetical protein
MKKPIAAILGLLFSLGCSSDQSPQVLQAPQPQQPKPYTWAHFDFVHDDDKATYVNIGLSGGMGKFGLNIECPSKGDDTQKLKAYVWVDKDELDRNADVRVKWDDAAFKTEHWDVSSRALKPPHMTEFVKTLTTKNRLTVEYVPVGAKEPNTIVLPLAGAEAQLHQYCPVPLSNSQGISQDNQTVLPETVRLQKTVVFSGGKTVIVSNQEGRYTLQCNLDQDSCLSPKPGRDYWLFTKTTKVKMEGASDYMTLKFLMDFSGSYNHQENMALVPVTEDRSHWGVYWLKSWDQK